MTEKVTMIELFSGIGAQERALRQLNIPYEVIATCDLDKDAVLSYASMRCDFEKEFENYDFPSVEQMLEELQTKGVGYDFQKDKQSITSRTPINKLKQYYLADKLSNNLGDISRLESLPYADLITYSYPCTDISAAGLGEGMTIKCDECNHSWPIDFSTPTKDIKCPNCGNTQIKSTRSGLLGEVQRLLYISYKENTLPKYLLLENVKNLVGKKFKAQFDSWLKWLDSIGYNTYYQILNAKHYGIPQNRERVFAVSVRKDVDNGTFQFSEQIPLTTRLKDVLEKDVDEKYYLPDERIQKILNSTFMQEKKRIQTTDVCDTLLARDWKDPKCVTVEDPKLDVAFNLYDMGIKGFNRDTGDILNPEGICKTIQTMQGGNRQPKILVTDDAEIKVVGNYMPSNHDASRVVDIDGIDPTVKENHGTVTAIAEPFIVASRGRNPENPSDRTVGAPTVQRLEPNTSGTTNTITTVQKDNYVVEPIVFDERKDEGMRLFKDDCVGTLRTIDACGDKRVLEPNMSPQLVGGIGEKNFGKQYRQGNRVYDSDAVAMALNAQPVGNAGGYSYLYAVEEPTHHIKWRIRKLTPKECWRLMGFDDIEHDRAAKYVSASALYKQAGNSICTCCLVAIFNALLLEDSSTSYKDKLVKYDELTIQN